MQTELFAISKAGVYLLANGPGCSLWLPVDIWQEANKTVIPYPLSSPLSIPTSALFFNVILRRSLYLQFVQGQMPCNPSCLSIHLLETPSASDVQCLPCVTFVQGCLFSLSVFIFEFQLCLFLFLSVFTHLCVCTTLESVLMSKAWEKVLSFSDSGYSDR